MNQPRVRNEEKFERIMGSLLRIGVLVAAAFVLAGGILYLARYGGTYPDYQIFQGEPKDLRTLPGILKASLTLRSRGLIQLGLLLLLATPVARVVFAAFAFVLQRDFTYVLVSLIVLAVLLYSLCGGIL